MTDTNDGPWPTEPTLAFGEGAALQRKVQALRFKHRELKAQGKFLPDEDPDDGLTPAGRHQLAWERIVPPIHATWRKGNLTDHAVDGGDKAFRWLRAGSAGVLLLAGSTGAGKTGLGSAVLYEHWSEGRNRVLFARAEDLLAAWVTYDDESRDLRRTWERASAPTMALIDDVGTSKARSTATEQALMRIVDTLLGNRVRVIVTTNLNKKERREHWSSPLRSRIENGGTHVGVGQGLSPTEADLRGRRPVPPRPVIEACPYRCANGLLEMENHPDGADMIVANARAERLEHPDPGDYPGLAAPVPQLPAGKGKDGHYHLGPGPCPRCGGAAPNVGAADVRTRLAYNRAKAEWETKFMLIGSLLIDCPHCRPPVPARPAPPEPDPTEEQGALL